MYVKIQLAGGVTWERRDVTGLSTKGDKLCVTFKVHSQPARLSFPLSDISAVEIDSGKSVAKFCKEKEGERNAKV